MAFQTEANSILEINGEIYTIGEHPYAPGVPYGQEGRQGTVYLLHSEDKRRKKAMKVFRSKLINPSTVHLSSQIGKFAGMDGLAACERMTITPHNNSELLTKEPDLLYAVIMPWIDGPTWMDIVLNKQQLTRRQSYTAAYALAEILVTMEQRGLAHCDLSGPNLIMPMFSEGRNQVKSSNFVQLIDLEQMFSIQFERPEYLPAGSPGYAPKYADAQMWNAQSDRFSGAVLLMEMLLSCTNVFAEHAWGESYFDPDEMQTLCRRYDYLLQAVKPIWGDGIASLVQRVWESDELNQCPTFGEWLLELSKVDQSVIREDATVTMGRREDAPAPAAVRKEERVSRSESAASREAAEAPRASAAASKSAPPLPAAGGQPELADQVRYSELMKKAAAYERKGNAAKAIEVYKDILTLKPHASVAKEIEIALLQLQKQLQERDRVKNKIAYDKLMKRAAQIISIAALLAGLGFGGYSIYRYFAGLAEAGPVPTKAEVQAVNAEIEELKQELAARDQTIAELNRQLEEFRKPLAQRSDELVQKLNGEYAEIKRLVETDPDGDPELHEKVYVAAEEYMDHVHEYYKNAYNLDETTVEQIRIVEGYYFPFIYNRNRNAQLNYKFLTDYKDHFLMGGSDR